MPRGKYIRTLEIKKKMSISRKKFFKAHPEEKKNISKKAKIRHKNNPTIQVGKNNPNWKGGKRSYIERTARNSIIKNGRSLKFCQKCKQKIKGLYNIHHKDRNRHNNNSSNLTVCCVNCHSKIHDKTRIRNKNGRFI